MRYVFAFAVWATLLGVAWVVISHMFRNSHRGGGMLKLKEETVGAEYSEVDRGQAYRNTRRGILHREQFSRMLTPDGWLREHIRDGHIDISRNDNGDLRDRSPMGRSFVDACDGSRFRMDATTFYAGLTRFFSEMYGATKAVTQILPVYRRLRATQCPGPCTVVVVGARYLGDVRFELYAEDGSEFMWEISYRDLLFVAGEQYVVEFTREAYRSQNWTGTARIRYPVTPGNTDERPCTLTEVVRGMFTTLAEGEPFRPHPHPRPEEHSAVMNFGNLPSRMDRQGNDIQRAERRPRLDPVIMVTRDDLGHLTDTFDADTAAALQHGHAIPVVPQPTYTRRLDVKRRRMQG